MTDYDERPWNAFTNWPDRRWSVRTPIRLVDIADWLGWRGRWLDDGECLILTWQDQDRIEVFFGPKGSIKGAYLFAIDDDYRAYGDMITGGLQAVFRAMRDIGYRLEVVR